MLRELSQLRPSLKPLPKPYGIAVRADMKNYPGRIVSKAIGHRTGTSRSPHLPERVRNTKSQSSPLNVYFLLSGSFNPRFYSFTSATVRIPVHASLKCGSEPIGCVTIQFWDQRVAASLRYRNRAEITFLCVNRLLSGTVLVSAQDRELTNICLYQRKMDSWFIDWLISLFLSLYRLHLLKNIECFHSHGQRLCKFIGTKESVCIRKEFNFHRTGLGHQHGHRFIALGHQYGHRDAMWKRECRGSLYWKPGTNIWCPGSL